MSNKVASECQNKRAPTHNGDPKYCNACKKVYCDTCYDFQLVHQDDENRLNEHEKTDIDIANFVLSLFSNKIPPEERERLHQDNIYSKWFGMAIDERESKSYLCDFGGFDRLLHGSKLLPHKRFPSLISFVGDTGAGKSTLVNGILRFPAQITQHVPGRVLSPVIGASYEQNVPTSGDVHLFSDPATRDTNYPAFYVDCEGIGGGEIIPAAAKCLEKLAKITDLTVFVKKQREMSRPETRGWAVRELYPSILFPFSDIVCYVTRNPRLFEHHLETMLLWAHKAIDRTTNQPMLPHAFLVINAFTVEEAPPGFFQDWWDVDQVTSNFLNMRRDLVRSASSIIGRLASQWNSQRGREITSLKQLIECYYRDFKIICIPETKFSRHSLITKQYRRLQNAITTASKNSRRIRQDLGFLMSAETLGRYLEMAFDHFTATPNQPFNFLSAALLRSPVTQTFKDHICKLAIKYTAINPTYDGGKLFKDLAPWVASCIFLNSHRFELPNNDVADAMFKQYQGVCQEAQAEFYERHWPCEATDKNGNRCVNIKPTHTAKGHQDRTGNIFFAKDPRFRLAFKSSFEAETDKKQAYDAFFRCIYEELECCIRIYKRHTDRGGPSKSSMKKAAAEVHIAMLAEFRKHDVMVGLVSHKTCFCCLASSPAHKLFCGHIICQLCLEHYSDEEDHLFCRILKKCPLCCACLPKGKELKFEMKPPTAGLRILCLDGGGIRSIIQLQILKQLERTVGLGIPIQNFFDLIVGTSGGGIVAAGIGMKRLSIDECIEMFTNFADKAFKKRQAIDWPVFGKLIMARHHGLYRTTGLESVLKDAFSQDHIFGADMGEKNRTIPSLKIGVTATSSGRNVFLLTNYNRPPLEKRYAKKAKTEDEDEAQNDGIGLWSINGGGAENSIAYDEVNDDISSGSYDDTSEDTTDEENPREASEGSSKGSSQESIDEGPAGSSRESLNEAIDTRSSYVFFRGENQETELKLWEAVRATSAAPGYFKSFFHSATKYTFDDGALKCNNPVFVADKERKTLWPEISKKDPDILLSIGTGFDPLPPAMEAIHRPLPKHGIRSFIRKMIKLGSAAILEDMDCEIMWQEFIGGLGIDDNAHEIDDNAAERLRRYQRLNLQLKTPIPNLDDIDQIGGLQRKAQEFASQSPKVKEIANTLIGALFYFELRSVTSDNSDHDWEAVKRGSDLSCIGRIKCRLESKTLAERMYSYEHATGVSQQKRIFLVGKRDGVRKGLEAYLTNRLPEPKIAYDVEFKLEQADQDKEFCIYLSLWDDYTKAVSISGFPRLLFTEAKSFSTSG